MRRIDRIRSMTASEVADAMMRRGMEDHIDFCPSLQECGDYLEEHGEVDMDSCRECLIKWLDGEADK